MNRTQARGNPLSGLVQRNPTCAVSSFYLTPGLVNLKVPGAATQTTPVNHLLSSNFDNIKERAPSSTKRGWSNEDETIWESCPALKVNSIRWGAPSSA